MTLLQIKYALTIYETGQFSKAADKLFVTQPSLTKAMNELEKELDITIFIRNRKGIIITDEGKEFIRYARQVYADYDILYEKFKDKKNIKRKFAISCQHYFFAVSAFVETIKHFDNSKYEFTIRETKTVDVINDLNFPPKKQAQILIKPKQTAQKILINGYLQRITQINWQPFNKILK